MHFAQAQPPSVLELPKLLPVFNFLQHPNLETIFIERLVSLISPSFTRHAHLVLSFINLETSLAVAFCLVTFPELCLRGKLVKRSRHLSLFLFCSWS